MKNAIIIYGSTTGKTETASKCVAGVLASGGLDVDVADASDAKTDRVAAYELVVLGASTWGQGDIQDDFISFYDAMAPEQFNGKKVAVFGCGDSSMFPDSFCQAVDLISEKAKECGAKIVAEPLKIDGEVDKTALEEWVQSLL